MPPQIREAFGRDLEGRCEVGDSPPLYLTIRRGSALVLAVTTSCGDVRATALMSRPCRRWNSVATTPGPTVRTSRALLRVLRVGWRAARREVWSTSTPACLVGETIRGVSMRDLTAGTRSSQKIAAVGGAIDG
ncbi:hypothetical protein [Homoserinibacter sp. YIM 151385]|uniref:hypothetical protein n=1 Tax=Homoserinibacter sp. YIM 151385 TaxID=2985506 RepID=UPI0022F06F81|nr:hypothetical protein [Homoserinibacter sp. YIM 151385]WBU38809.1 hypothetical protein OF852_04295 [Homoserinibacter sp. YIM 151385]